MILTKIINNNRTISIDDNHIRTRTLVAGDISKYDPNYPEVIYSNNFDIINYHNTYYKGTSFIIETDIDSIITNLDAIKKYHELKTFVSVQITYKELLKGLKYNLLELLKDIDYILVKDITNKAYYTFINNLYIKGFNIIPHLDLKTKFDRIKNFELKKKHQNLIIAGNVDKFVNKQNLYFNRIKFEHIQYIQNKLMFNLHLERVIQLYFKDKIKTTSNHILISEPNYTLIIDFNSSKAKLDYSKEFKNIHINNIESIYKEIK